MKTHIKVMFENPKYNYITSNVMTLKEAQDYYIDSYFTVAGTDTVERCTGVEVVGDSPLDVHLQNITDYLDGRGQI